MPKICNCQKSTLWPFLAVFCQLPFIFYKTEVQTIILRCWTGLKLQKLYSNFCRRFLIPKIVISFSFLKKNTNREVNNWFVWHQNAFPYDSWFKVHIFWEGHKILRNHPLTFDCMHCSQKQRADVEKYYALIRTYDNKK